MFTPEYVVVDNKLIHESIGTQPVYNSVSPDGGSYVVDMPLELFWRLPRGRYESALKEPLDQIIDRPGVGLCNAALQTANEGNSRVEFLDLEHTECTT